MTPLMKTSLERALAAAHCAFDCGTAPQRPSVTSVNRFAHQTAVAFGRNPFGQWTAEAIQHKPLLQA
jgi:hypothetical protein